MKAYSNKLTVLLIASLFVAFAVRHCASLPHDIEYYETVDLDADNDTTTEAGSSTSLAPGNTTEPRTDSTLMSTASTAAPTPGGSTKAPPPPPPPQPSGSFDVGSFFGGIALGAGVVVLGYCAYIFYKRRVGRNYQRM